MTVGPAKPDTPPRSLILASASPRRAELLREHGLAFEVIVPPIEEPSDLSKCLSPPQQAEALSYFKAKSVAVLIDDGWVLGGDTIAVVGERVIGKPADRADAKRILQALSGTTHHVITGVTLLDVKSGVRLIRHDSTAVIMGSLTDDELERYLDTGAWQGKAGAYGIQDHGDAFVERIEGSFTNVVGLPMELLRIMLTEWGWS